MNRLWHKFCNHVSFVDALIIAAASRRPVRFVMEHHVFRLPILSFVFKASRAIPIVPENQDAMLKQQAFDEVLQAFAGSSSRLDRKAEHFVFVD